MSIVSAMINGRSETFEAAPMETLLSVLRGQFFLFGTKGGCHEGVCGACTVLVDGSPVNACLFIAQAAMGLRIETVEGLVGPEADAVRKGMIAAGAVQCGYCTPGFVVMLTSLLRNNQAIDEDTVRAALVGNLCRCTGYAQILDAANAASRELVGAQLANL